MQRPTLFSALVAALVLSGCAAPYSQLSGDRYHRAPIDTYPVAIVEVDGRSQLRDPLYLEPGRHELVVQAPPGGAGGYGARQSFVLEVQPCTRYWLVAVKEHPLASRFETQVDHAEPLSGCVPPR